MLATHLSHFDAKEIGRTKDNVVFSGTLAAMRRLAFSHGMEVEKYEGRTVSFDSTGSVTTLADATNFAHCWFKGGGLISKGQDDYCLVMPISLWIDG